MSAVCSTARADLPVTLRCKCRDGDGRLTYGAVPVDRLRIVALDSLTAIYHCASGQTHVVSEPAPQILAALMTGDAALPALMERLHLPDTGDTRAVLIERLQELVAAGLIAQR